MSQKLACAAVPAPRRHSCVLLPALQVGVFVIVVVLVLHLMRLGYNATKALSISAAIGGVSATACRRLFRAALGGA